MMNLVHINCIIVTIDVAVSLSFIEYTWDVWPFALFILYKCMHHLYRITIWFTIKAFGLRLFLNLHKVRRQTCMFSCCLGFRVHRYVAQTVDILKCYISCSIVLVLVFLIYIYICLKFKVLSQCRLMLLPASLWCSAFYFVAWSFVLHIICFVWSLLPRCCSEFFPCATGATWPATALDRESSTNRRIRVQCTVNLRQRCMLWPPSSWANLFMLVS